MNTLCKSCSLPLFEHASDFMVREGHACRGDCKKVRKGGLLPVPAVLEPKANKYGAKRSLCSQGHMHASGKERERCEMLHFMQEAGEIRNLEYEPPYVFEANGVRIGSYKPDFRYTEDGGLGETVVEDCKSKPTMTTAYRLRKKMMLAFFGISVKEI